MRTLLLAVATPIINALFSDKAMNETMLLDQPEQKFLDDQELIISVGTYPCVFKFGDNFYDYTPFKLAASDQEIVPEAAFITNPD